MTFDVVGFGALNQDKLYHVNKIAKEDEEAYIKNIDISCGGSAANTMIGLSKLNLNTSIIGKVAEDDEGRELLRNLRNEGVNTSGLIRTSKGRSGQVIGFVDMEGQRALYVDPGVNDNIKIAEVSLDLAYNAKIIHLTSFVGKSIKVQEALLKELPSNVKVSFDPGRIYVEKGLEYIVKILNKTDILLINEDELNLLTDKKYKTIEEKIESLKSLEIEIIIVKLGHKGCYATDGEESLYVEAFQTECKDTTGAGDAFNAGCLYGLLEGKTLRNSCVIGNYVASCSVENFGATKGLPDINKLKKLSL
ncbi:MAG: carbohydrate kinase family protein [Methanobacterium sp.]|nr:carbohydrate kinase family protein [Methanobacterium sp.]